MSFSDLHKSCSVTFLWEEYKQTIFFSNVYTVSIVLKLIPTGCGFHFVCVCTVHNAFMITVSLGRVETRDRLHNTGSDDGEEDRIHLGLK